MTDIIIEKTDEVLRLDVSKIPIGKFKLVPVENPSKSVAVPSSFQFLENPAEDIYTAKDGDPVKPELRDGDVIQWIETGNFVYLYDPYKAKLTMQYVATPLTSPYRFVLNILDLTDAVQRGEKIVTLTRTQANLLIGYLGKPEQLLELEQVRDKLRAAMEAKP